MRKDEGENVNLVVTRQLFLCSLALDDDYIDVGRDGQGYCNVCVPGGEKIIVNQLCKSDTCEDE